LFRVGPNVRFSAAKLFENSVFVAAFDRDRHVNLIYRGYLE
jgi:hypothetical protein